MNDNPALTTSFATPVYSDLFWTSTDGLQIAARRWIVANSRALVLLVHGIGDHSGRFERVAETMNATGFSVLAADLRGHGRSGGQRGYIKDFDTLVADLDQTLEKTREISPDQHCFIYGQSMGALLSILYVLKRRPTITGLIASSPALRIAMNTPAWKVSLGKALRSAMPRISLDSGLDVDELSDDPQVAARIRVDRFRHRRVTPEAYFGMVECGRWCLQNADRLTCPALIMHGRQDRITDHTASIEFAESSDQCCLQLWEDGKHELHNMTYHDQVLATVTDFQNRCIHAGSRQSD